MTSGTQYDNMELLKIQSGEHPLTGRDPGAVVYAAGLIRKGMERGSRKAAFYFRWQFYTLIIGAVFFIAWHILAMYLRTAYEVHLSGGPG